jgi:hypothetical protein
MIIPKVELCTDLKCGDYDGIVVVASSVEVKVLSKNYATGDIDNSVFMI